MKKSIHKIEYHKILGHFYRFRFQITQPLLLTLCIPTILNILEISIFPSQKKRSLHLIDKANSSKAYWSIFKTFLNDKIL